MTTKRKVLASSIIIITVLIAMVVVIMIAKPQSKQTLPTFRFSTNTWIGYGPMYLAQEKGYFKDEGINVDISVMDDQAQRVAAMSKGDIDGYGDTVDLLVLTRGNEVPSVAVAQIDFSNGADGIVVTDNIKTIQDLKGKTIALQKSYVDENFLLYLLKKNNISESDIKVVDMESGAAGAAFIAGQVDGAATFEPWLSKAKERKGGKILVSSSNEPGIVVDVLSINQNYLVKNPENVKKVMRAWFRAVDYIKSNPDESYQIMAKYYKVSPKDFADMATGLKWPSYQENLEYFGTTTQPGKIYEVANTFGDIFLEQKTINSKPDLNKAIDNSILASLNK